MQQIKSIDILMTLNMNCPLHLRLGFSQCDVAKMILLELGIPTPLFCDNAKTKKPRFLKIQLRFYAYFPALSSTLYVEGLLIQLLSALFLNIYAHTWKLYLSKVVCSNTLLYLNIELFFAKYDWVIDAIITFCGWFWNTCSCEYWAVSKLFTAQLVSSLFIFPESYGWYLTIRSLRVKNMEWFAANLCITSADSDNFRNWINWKQLV